jgi:NAD(P)-dependent dehydrogenase (short-subunit alcohol dehydrogenase family)
MDLKNLTGRVCVVTGANSGIGKETAKGLANQGAHVVMVCRDAERGAAAQEEIRATAMQAQGIDYRVDLLLADLATQSEVRSLADTLLTEYDRLDVLVNNAGVFLGERELTTDGIEATFAINHLAPFLLTHLVLDRMNATARAEGEARIVVVSSEAHRGVSLTVDDLNAESSYSPMQAYGQSKLANVLFTHELARRIHDTKVTVNAVHPGVVATNIFRDSDWFSRIARFFKVFYKNPEEGAKGPLYLAASPELDGVSGEYFNEAERVNPSPEAYNEKIAARLWQVSRELTDLTDPEAESEEPL